MIGAPAEGEADDDGLRLGDSLALGERDGLAEPDGDKLGLSELEGLKLKDWEIEGLSDADGLAEGDADDISIHSDHMQSVISPVFSGLLTSAAVLVPEPSSNFHNSMVVPSTPGAIQRDGGMKLSPTA